MAHFFSDKAPFSPPRNTEIHDSRLPVIADMRLRISARPPPLPQQHLEGVHCYYYLGLLEGEIAANITTIEATEVGVGILDHVFTRPAHRRRTTMNKAASHR